jgi:H2-forming N5,N10-methylenetetrahydromethanopterin dehydrogenase-like enzyme
VIGPAGQEARHRLATVQKGLEELVRQDRDLAGIQERLRTAASIAPVRDRDAIARQYRQAQLEREQLGARRLFLYGQREQLEREMRAHQDLAQFRLLTADRLEQRIRTLDRERALLVARLREIRKLK